MRTLLDWLASKLGYYRKGSALRINANFQDVKLFSDLEYKEIKCVREMPAFTVVKDEDIAK